MKLCTMLLFLLNSTIEIALAGIDTTSVLAENGTVDNRNFDNQMDGELKFRCPSGEYISHMYSHHNNHHEDRQFKFQCRKGGISNQCYLTGYQNSFDHNVDMHCSTDYAIVGMESYHNSHHEDRRWKFWCCKATGGLYDPIHSPWLNNYDGVMNYPVPEGYVIHGVFSTHNSRKEDRIWKLRLAKMNICTVTNIRALNYVPAQYIGTKVIGVAADQVCKTDKEERGKISNTKSQTNSRWVSRSRTSTNTFDFSSTISVNFGIEVEKKPIKVSGGGSVSFTASFGHSVSKTTELKDVRTEQESVTIETSYSLKGPEGGLFVVITDEFKYNQQEVPVELTIKCDRGSPYKKRDKMIIRGHEFTNFRPMRFYSPRIQEQQCDYKTKSCLGSIARFGNFITTNGNDLQKKVNLCYGQSSSESGFLVSSSGGAKSMQSDKIGFYKSSSETINGKPVWKHEKNGNKIYYTSWGGWRMGPRPNWGGIASAMGGNIRTGPEGVTRWQYWNNYGWVDDSTIRVTKSTNRMIDVPPMTNATTTFNMRLDDGDNDDSKN